MFSFLRRNSGEQKPATEPVVQGPNGQPLVPGSRGVYVHKRFREVIGSQAVLSSLEADARLEEAATAETHLEIIATLFTEEATKGLREII